jgi:hypothetical protein
MKTYRKLSFNSKEDGHHGMKINFNKKSLIPPDESILPHETRVQVLNILILFNVTFER